MSKMKRFEGRLGEIEWEIVDFLVQSPLFVGQSEYMPVIKSYFITRRDLTQKDIKELTGYSTGVISQALNELVKMGFVEKYNELTKAGIKGDILFDSLLEFASNRSSGFREQAAGLAVLSYFFETCDVFET